MKKKILFLLIAITFSSEVFSCGNYQVIAQVSMINGLSTLVVNPGTKSEINLSVEFNESAKLSPYINRFIETKVNIEKKMDYTRGVVASLGAITVVVPDLLAPSKGTKFTLLKKTDCKK